jgi:hypothetical protein
MEKDESCNPNSRNASSYHKLEEARGKLPQELHEGAMTLLEFWWQPSAIHNCNKTNFYCLKLLSMQKVIMVALEK